MIPLVNDYSQGAHPDIWDALTSSTIKAHVGYGLDEETEKAVALIKKRIQSPLAQIHFVAGGTMANALVISSILRPYEAVIACDHGHINVLETGAVEYTGHKILTRPNPLGKVTPEMVEEIMESHTSEHMVKPAMVYISQSTEVGTLYKKAELEALYACAKSYGLKLFIDGARLGSAITSPHSDIDLEDLPQLCDVFTIGGTKNGALFGEAIVILDESIGLDFRYQIKNRGAMMAKGFVLGIQFQTLFKGNLYSKMAKHANDMASILVEGAKEAGWEPAYPPESNQLFYKLTKEQVEKYAERVAFEVHERNKDRLVIRLVTSWASTEEEIQLAANLMKEV